MIVQIIFKLSLDNFLAPVYRLRIYSHIIIYSSFMAWLRERRLRRGSSTSPAGTHVADKADAGEACPVAVVAGEGLVWD